MAARCVVFALSLGACAGWQCGEHFAIGVASARSSRSRIAPRCVVDPVRAGRRPPIEPLAINALAKGLKLAADAALDGVIDEALAKRTHDPDASLLADEERLLREWIGGTLARRDAYRAALETIAAGEPFFATELGIGPDDNPYVMLCRAECMLALYLLRDAAPDARRPVAFIDSDRLEVLTASANA